MTASSRDRLRTTFTRVAELYRRARPGYPERLFDDLAARAKLQPGSRVLELGCGTGQATVALAERGYRVTAVELGAEMAAVARRELSGHGEVAVVNAAFEGWPLPDEPFDAVVSATAFAWIDPAVRVAKSAAALRPGGVLATVATHHVRGGSTGFFDEVQGCYERFDPEMTPGFRLPGASELEYDAAEILDSERFAEPEFLDYVTDREYTTASYLDVLRTYSPNIDMGPRRREAMLACIGNVLERHGGRITKRYLRRLRLARRLG